MRLMQKFIFILSLIFTGALTNASELFPPPRTETLPSAPAVDDRPIIDTTPNGWLNNYATAREKARAENKTLMMYLTGSDWCGYCQMLMKEVFNTPVFLSWAERNVVRLYVDLPKLKRLSPAIEQQNALLMRQYNPQGAVPQVYFITPQDEVITNIGYLPGGAELWTRNVTTLLPKNLHLEKNLSSAAQNNQQQKLPVLLIVRNGDADNAAIKSLLATPAITNNSAENMLVVNIDLAKIDPPSLERWRDLAAKNKWGAQLPLVILFNHEWQKMYVSEKINAPTKIANEILQNLPRPVYNGEWLDDYPTAQKVARLLNRPLLLIFSGNDWSERSQKFNAALADTPEFIDYAKKNLVLVMLDFPKTKKLAEDILLQNQLLAQAFDIRDFPVAIVMNPSATPLGAFGYTENSTVADYLTMIKQALEGK